jgi:hypothetical protein
MTCPCDNRSWPPTLSIVPGLDDLPRQLVAFWDLREEMLTRASQEPALAAWTGRARDDYGVMLLELWAYVGELLSIYDKAIADESYVRTAKLRPSLRRLVASLGYLPRPAVAATAELALLADGVKPVTVPVGTAFRSGAFGSEKPQVFELTEAAAIHPALNQWPIATPVATTLSGSFTQLFLDPSTVKLVKGDVVLLALSNQASQTYVRTVAALDRIVDDAGRRVTQLTLDAAVDAGAGVAVSGMTIQRATQKAALKTPQFVAEPSIAGGTFVLDGIYRNIHANNRIIIDLAGYQTWATVSSRSETNKTVADGTTTKALEITSTDKDGNVTTIDVPATTTPAVKAPFTVIESDYQAPNKFIELQVPSYGWTSTWLSMGWISALWLPDPTDYTIYFGLVDAGRVLGPLQKTISPGDPLIALRTRAPIHSTASTEQIILRDTEQYAVEIGGTIRLGPGAITPDGGATWSPPLATPVTGFGNVVTATRGETVAREVLGSGDASQNSQAFKLAKKPLTYVAAPGTDSGVASTLRVWVDGLLWTEVPTLYGQPATAQVYAVRQGDDDASIVTFGDGIRGSRLTTGAGNVVASYRFGSGAAAPPAGSISQISKPVPGLKGMVGPLAAVGGADSEPASSLATLAPRSALLLGRAISIDDMEVAALGAPGVTTARADWAWDGVAQRPVVKVWIVGADEQQPTFLAQVAARLRALAEPSTPIRIAYATLNQARLSIDLEIDPRRIAADVIAAAEDALTGDGGWLLPAQLGIDRPLFRSVLIERLCTITGVTGVRGLTWNGVLFTGYGMSPGQGAVFELVSQLKVTGS